MSLFAKKYRKFFNKFNQGKNLKKNQRRNEEKEDNVKKDDIMYYDCKKPSHKRPDCPLKKTNKKNAKKNELKKVLKATWDQLELSES